jgi:hypothetical protein
MPRVEETEDEMTVEELIKALKNAKNQKAEVYITDTEGSFDEELFSVDEDEENVRIVIATAKL